MLKILAVICVALLLVLVLLTSPQTHLDDNPTVTVQNFNLRTSPKVGNGGLTATSLEEVMEGITTLKEEDPCLPFGSFVLAPPTGRLGNHLSGLATALAVAEPLGIGVAMPKDEGMWVIS